MSVWKMHTLNPQTCLDVGNLLNILLSNLSFKVTLLFKLLELTYVIM